MKTFNRQGFKRRSYRRRDGTQVRTCKVPPCKVRLPAAKSGKLYGYQLSLMAPERRRILKKAIRRDSYATVIRRLTWLKTINKSRPSNYVKIDQDINYLRKNVQGL